MSDNTRISRRAFPADSPWTQAELLDSVQQRFNP
jgi:hypothetical protein